MRAKYPVLGEVRDVDGSLWEVRDIRTTKHGFDLLFGSPVSRLQISRWGLPRLIATQALVDYWDENRTKLGKIYDLPAGRTTIKRLRRRLGFHSGKDRQKFWKARLQDLRTLSAREFAAKHDVPVDVVVDTRLRLLGKTARELNWWHDPKALEILRSNITLREIGERLGIKTTQAGRLKRRALQLQQTPHEISRPANNNETPESEPELLAA